MVERLSDKIPGLVRRANGPWKYSTNFETYRQMMEIATGWPEDHLGPGKVEVRPETFQEWFARKEQE